MSVKPLIASHCPLVPCSMQSDLDLGHRGAGQCLEAKW